MNWLRVQVRVRVLMLLVVVAAVILGALAESSRAERRWAGYVREAEEHASREAFYRQSAERFEELAKVASEIASSLDSKSPDAKTQREQADSLRHAANEYLRAAATEAREARECLRRW